jgi:ligand-binding sensor domain-containing protein
MHEILILFRLTITLINCNFDVTKLSDSQLFSISSLCIMRKVSCFFILSLFLAVSCEKNDLINNFPATIKFNITSRLLKGKQIDCIDIDKKGNIFIGSGSELYYINGSELKNYSLDFQILDLAIAPDQTVWIGTGGKGLGHFTGKGFTWYTSTNAGLPRDYVRHVEIAPDGDIWFTSCAFRIGGLGVYDGEKFEFFTPENSPLNQNIIEDIEIDQDGRVYIATTGTVGKTNIYRISNKSWECLGDEKGTFYWVFSFTVGPSGIIYLVEDFSLSSSWPSPNKLYEFRDNKWKKIETDDITIIGFFGAIKADKRNYCWLAGNGEHSPLLHVYNGKSWINSPEEMFPEDYITTIEIDNDNNIWIGTSQNGIFILNQ